MIDLKRFCATDYDHREYLQSPWIDGGLVYATNGHVCVRVSPDLAQPCEGRTNKHPDPAKMFAKWGGGELSAYTALPTLPKLLACSHCDGKALFNVMRCPDCKDGEFEHGIHTYECKTCEDEPVKPGWLAVAKDTGKTMSCDECIGRGSQMGSVKVGDGVYAELIYLTWLSKLPGLVYRTNGGMNAIHFKFDGGEALLMQRTR